MGREAFLFGMHEIGRQQQNAVRARAFGGSGQIRRDGGAIAGGGNHRLAAFGFGHCRGHDFFNFGRRQRKKLAGAAGGKQSGDIVAAQPVQIRAILGFIESEIRRERRYRER